MPEFVPPPPGEVALLWLLDPRVVGENPWKGRDIDEIPSCWCTRGFRGNRSDGPGIFAMEGGGEEFLVIDDNCRIAVVDFM